MATISDKRGVGGRAGRAGLGWLGGRYDGTVGRGATTSIFLQNTEYRLSVKTLRHLS